MQYVLIWWIIIQIIGWAATPLAFRLFCHLPDRGYALAKPLGLLLVSYVFWLACTLGFLQNTWGSMVFCLAIVAAGGGYLYFRERRVAGTDDSLVGFLRAHWPVVAASEVLFLVGFAAWAAYRAYNPAISATEKPMEFAFLNGILRSGHFPPLDPWLSGYGISYYYFGYVMVAVLTRLSGVASAIAFNLAIALLFAWTLTGAFSLVYNLVQGFHTTTQAVATRRRWGAAIGFGLLGAWAVTIAGNLEGFFEALHARGIGSEAFWVWLDIKNLAQAPVTGSWYPTDNWWWWRASRVIHDKDPLGHSIEVIDEFPFFSFLLGDMHPHVLALPFVLLALGLALNLAFAGRQAVERPASGGRLARLQALFGEPTWVFLAYAICVGAIGFLNTWDLPIYFAIVIGAFALRRQRENTGRDWLADSVLVAVLLGLSALVLYVPFYMSFQSQAGGLAPQLLATTRWPQYVVMFGLPLFLLGGLWVARWAAMWRALSAGAEKARAVANLVTLWIGLYVIPTLAMGLLIVLLLLTARGRDFLEGIRNNDAVRQVLGDLPWNALMGQLFLRRLTQPWTAVGIALLLAAGIALLVHGISRTAAPHAEPATALADTDPPAESRLWEPAVCFAVWIAVIGLLLTFSVEFVYLRDTFGTRMNTVFKFYYQGWVLMNLAGVFGAFYVLRGWFLPSEPGSDVQPHRFWRATFAVGLAALVGITAVYPVLAGYNKADAFQVRPTLDGTDFMAQYSADDHAAIEWLNHNVSGAPVILEATGGSYSQYARVSAQTGLPTVLGWGGHELQWRGNYDEAGKREPDIDQIYNSFDPKLTLTLLDKYGINYVYVGSLERDKYSSAALAKFDRLLDVAYRHGAVTIYQRRR